MKVTPPFCLRLRPHGQARRELEQPRDLCAEHARLGDEVPVNAVDGELTEVAAARGIEVREDAVSVLRVDAREEGLAAGLALGEGDGGAQGLVELEAPGGVER